MILFFLNLSGFLIKKKVPKTLVNLSFTAGLISSIGNIMTGMFPGDGSQDLHNFASSFFFLGGLAYSILYGISELKSKDISKIQALSGFLVSAAFVVFIIFTSINYFNLEEALEISHFSEWILMLVLLLWIIGQEVSMIKCQKLT